MLKGEKPETVTGRLELALKKIQRVKNAWFTFAGAKIPTLEMFPSLINLRYTIGKARNLPGGSRVPIEFKVSPGTPYFKLFLPRDENGDFINLGAQKLCLKRLEVLPDIREILANVIVHKSRLAETESPINRRGMKIMFTINGPSPAIMNGVAEKIVMLILMARALFKNQGFKAGGDEPIVYSSDRFHSDFVRFKYKNLRPGDFKIACSDIRVDCRYSSNSNGKVVLMLA